MWFNKTNSTKNNECSSVNGMFSCEIPIGVVIGALFVLLSTISEGVSLDEKWFREPNSFSTQPGSVLVKNNLFWTFERVVVHVNVL